MTKKIRKAIIPAAGFGTRFLPATKAMPKEMLPIVDKPIIQYVVEDAVSAGIEDIIIVTGWSKRSIEDHFDYPFELEKRLQESNKYPELEEIRRIADLANFYYVRQKGPLGNATPILNAKHFIGDEPFLVLWGDDFIQAQPSRSKQLIEAYEKHGGSALLGSMRFNQPEDYKRYGYAAGKEVSEGVLKISQIIEKPGAGMIDSDYAVISGSVFEPEFFDAIEESAKRLEAENTPRELVYVDAVNILLEQKKNCYAIEIKNGKYHDCGNKLEYLKTVVEFGLKHKELKDGFGEYLKNLKI
ncbi:MAG: UTP--glucose-1-phosphate uridylyltransferase [Candidatus Doudnabacteria bacterium]|jgi:UTP--glucose-1-phosphate uridylyltransferase